MLGLASVSPLLDACGRANFQVALTLGAMTMKEGLPYEEFERRLHKWHDSIGCRVCKTGQYAS